MNYDKSLEILEEIRKAKRILLNCHRSPDPDSVGSALGMRRVLLNMSKKVDVVCPDTPPYECRFLAGFQDIRRIDFDEFDFSGYDLFLVLDSSEWTQVLGYGKEKIPDIKKIVIDHHYTNNGFGEVNLVDSKRSSTAEIILRILKDWEIDISSEVAEDLLSGVIYDTSSLQHPGADIETARTMVDLMELGANKNRVITNIFRNLNINKVRFMGEVLSKMQLDEKNRFVWTAIPYETYIKYPNAIGVKSMVASAYASSIEDADLGIIMIEEKKDFLNISFRAKEGKDISEIAQELGGGGHKEAGATVIRNVSFTEAVEKVLSAVKKYASKN